MQTFITQTSLARRVNLAPATLVLRLRELAIEPDGVVINGTKAPGLLFNMERLTELRRALTKPAIIA